MTLTVPTNIGIGRTQEDSTHATWDSYEDVTMELSLLGVDLANKPPFPRPVIRPEQYANLEGDAYSILMAQIDVWFEYMRAVQAQLEGRLIATRNEMDIIGVDLRADIRRQVESQLIKKPSESEMKDRVKELPRYRVLLKLEQDLEIAQKQVVSIVESLERYAKGLSRQVTLRTMEMELSGMEKGRRMRGGG